MPRKSHGADPEGDYKVGYRRPPRQHQFQKGRSGNPRGRPKGTLNVSAMIMQRLSARVNVRENGKARRISGLEALVVKALNDALQGRPKAFIDILKALHSAGLFNPNELEQPAFPMMVRSTVRIIRPEPRPGDPNYGTSPNTGSSPHPGFGSKDD